MSRQNTFTIIPAAGHHDADHAAPARPMTSKQVRKAYKAATKTPTMTRAERHRWEREEQERIKKEHDKERTAAKARMAREKKREKEAQQREEKRKRGMPLVSVRPSQDTIARFVRGRKRDAEGVELRAEGGGESEGKAMQLDCIQEVGDVAINDEDLILQEDDVEERQIQNDESRCDTPAGAAGITTNIDDNNKNAGMATTIKENDTSAEIRATTQNSLTSAEIIEAAKDDDNSAEREATAQDNDQGIETRDLAQNSHKNAEIAATTQDPVEVVTDDLIESDLDGVLSIDADLQNESVLEAPQSLHIPEKPHAHNIIQSQDSLLDDEDLNLEIPEELDEIITGRKTPMKANIPEEPQPRNTGAIQANHAPTPTSMKPPSLPAVMQRKTKSPSHPKRVELPSSSPEPPRQPPPSCTQAILVNFDDFFPTSSQQWRELEEEDDSSQQSLAPPAATTMSPHNIQANIYTAKAGNAETMENSATESKEKTEPEEFESDFGSFPSTAQFSLMECSMAQLSHTTPQAKPQATVAAAPVLVQKDEHPAEAPPAASPTHRTPSRFFTSSGSREQLSLALQRSRRSAALEQIQERERQRQEAGLLMRQSKREEPPPALTEAKTHQSSYNTARLVSGNTSGKGSTVECNASVPLDKENMQPLSDGPRGSQETEYGGDWVEDAAWDLALC